MHTPNLRWSAFLLFRILPPAIIFGLLGAVLNKYAPSMPLFPFLLLASLGSSAGRSGRMMLSKRNIPAERWVHASLVALSLMVAGVVSLFDDNALLTKLAPDFSGVVDNLWSSLLAALFVVLYLDATKFNANASKKTVNNADAYVAHWFDKIEHKHGSSINRLCAQDFLCMATAYSVLILENRNRPRLLRIFENCIVRLPWCSATVGLAQVWSTRPLSDHQSVELGVQRLTESIARHRGSMTNVGVPQLPRLAVAEYNDDPRYPDLVEEVFVCLLRLRPTKFGIAFPA
jgi:hypothetical protein